MINWGQIRQYVEQRIGGMVLYIRTAGNPSATGAKDQVTMLGQDGAETAIPARRMGPFGLRWCQPADCEGIALNVGGRLQLVLIAAESGKYGPTDLEGGEVSLYDMAGSTIELRKDGNVLVRAKGGGVIEVDKDGNVKITAAAGKDIVHNGGTAQVARKGDHCKINPVGVGPSFLASWMLQVETAINLLAAGSVAPPSSTFLVAPGIVIDEGAEHVKA